MDRNDIRNCVCLRRRNDCICIFFSHFKDLTKLNAPGYICPQCKSKCCELPTQCKTCGISLATSSHLVRPIHYLIPLPCFTEPRNLSGSFKCYGCQSSINTKSDKVSFFFQIKH